MSVLGIIRIKKDLVDIIYTLDLEEQFLWFKSDTGYKEYYGDSGYYAVINCDNWWQENSIKYCELPEFRKLLWRNKHNINETGDFGYVKRRNK